MSKMFALFESTLRQAVKELDAERMNKEVSEKFCCACETMHPIEAFGWRTAKHLDRKASCKVGTLKQYDKWKAKQENGEKVRKYQKSYNLIHKQDHSKSNKARYEARKAIA